MQALHQLQAIGLPIVLDDFGTGYSSLSHLRNFSIDMVKVDRLFVSNLTNENKDEAIVAAVLGMAETFGLDVVAEGVETEEQAERLTELGCRFAQGYLFSKPMPADELGAIGSATAPIASAGSDDGTGANGNGAAPQPDGPFPAASKASSLEG